MANEHMKKKRSRWNWHCDSYFWVKYLLFAINFLVWVGGVCMMVIGVWARLQKARLNSLAGLPTDPAFFLVSVGVVIFLITIFGCMGSVKENVTFLKIFCVILLVVFVLQAIASILAFVFIDKVDKFLLDYMNRAISLYQDNQDLKVNMDYIQERFECCGSSSYVDWEYNRFYNCKSESQLRCGVPLSCCKQRRTVSCGYDVRHQGEVVASKHVYTRGCIGTLMSMFKDHLIVIGFMAFAIGILELVAVLLAHTLIRYVVLSKLHVNSIRKYRMSPTAGRPRHLMSYPTPPNYPSTTNNGVQLTHL